MIDVCGALEVWDVVFFGALFSEWFLQPAERKKRTITVRVCRERVIVKDIYAEK
jgi:hypothetical protein